MITISKCIYLPTDLGNSKIQLEQNFSSYSLRETSENTFEGSVSFSGLGMFAVLPASITIRLIPHGRNATLADITVQNDGSGFVQRRGCKGILRSVERKLSSKA